MGRRFGRVDYRELKAFQRKLEKLRDDNFNTFCEECVKELAARLLREAKELTPTGKYKYGGKAGGHLKRSWFVSNMEISGGTYTVEVINNAEYAIFVEFGHRTRGHKKWVPGSFMLTIASAEIQDKSERILERKLDRYLRSIFDD